MSYTLRELLDDHYLYHQKFQHDYLITAKAGLTEYGQYRQALRELYVRIRSLREAITTRDLNRVDIDEIEHRLKADDYDDLFTRRKDEINLRQKIMYDEEANRTVKEIIREGQRFYEQACYFKDLLDELTPERRNEYEREMWYYHVLRMVNVEYQTTGRIGVHGLEHYLSLPEDLRKKAIKYIKNAPMLAQMLDEKTNELVTKTGNIPKLKQAKLFDKPFELELGDGQ